MPSIYNEIFPAHTITSAFIYTILYTVYFAEIARYYQCFV